MQAGLWQGIFRPALAFWGAALIVVLVGAGLHYGFEIWTLKQAAPDLEIPVPGVSLMITIVLALGLTGTILALVCALPGVLLIVLIRKMGWPRPIADAGMALILAVIAQVLVLVYARSGGDLWDMTGLVRALTGQPHRLVIAGLAGAVGGLTYAGLAGVRRQDV